MRVSKTNAIWCRWYNTTCNSPQVTRPDQVDQRSRDAFYSKMMEQLNLEPIVLNNSQGAVVPDQTAVSPIESG